jgi:hypothetical protein
MSQGMSEDLLWGQVVARAWSDVGFMERLRTDPRALLAEHGLEVPVGTEVKVVEGTEVKVVGETATARHFVFPANPPDELIEEELAGKAVAWWCGGCGRCGACGCRCRC